MRIDLSTHPAQACRQHSHVTLAGWMVFFQQTRPLRVSMVASSGNSPSQSDSEICALPVAASMSTASETAGTDVNACSVGAVVAGEDGSSETGATGGVPAAVKVTHVRRHDLVYTCNTAGMPQDADIVHVGRSWQCEALNDMFLWMIRCAMAHIQALIAAEPLQAYRNLRWHCLRRLPAMAEAVAAPQQNNVRVPVRSLEAGWQDPSRQVVCHFAAQSAPPPASAWEPAAVRLRPHVEDSQERVCMTTGRLCTKLTHGWVQACVLLSSGYRRASFDVSN